jgi:flagellar basal-body rod protein FlgF
MADGIYVATAGAVAQSQALDVTANNVANAGTPGYKSERVRFAQVLATSKDMAFVGVAGTAVDASPGPMRQTGEPLDLAIAGDGWFAVDTAKGVRYTRDGSFQLDDAGQLVTSDGLAVLDQQGGAIRVPAGAAEISVAADGSVLVDGEEVGRIAVARFAPGGLTREGANLFVAGSAPLAGEPATIESGALEGANFNVVRGVIDLVKLSRTYEALHRMIESYRDIDQRTARDIGGAK